MACQGPQSGRWGVRPESSGETDSGGALVEGRRVKADFSCFADQDGGIFPIMKPFSVLVILSLISGFLSGCAETATQPGSALPIEHQDTSATVPGNAPIVDRMGVDGTQHYHRKVTTVQ